MTVSTSDSRVQYDTNGTTGPWTVDFPFLEDEHLAVTYTDSAGDESLLTLNVDYTVTGGTVTTTVAYAAGGTITIQRDVPATQETDLRDTDAFPADIVERALDKLTMLSQQVISNLRRTLRVPEITADLPEFPDVANRALKLAGFDASGNPTAIAPVDGTASALALLLASAALTSQGSGAIGHNSSLNYVAGTLGHKALDWVSPTDYPWLADNTYTNDATAAINACYQFCKATGRGMRPRNGRYKIQASTTTFELPRDDGSYSPTIGGGETTLSAEAATTMPVALVFDGDVEVVGESAEGVIFEGNWTYSSSAINTSQRIGILQGANKDSYTQFKLKNIHLKNFMLPLVIQGAATQSAIDVVIDGAAIASLVQAADGNTKFSGRLIRCYGGVIVGGWWLQRNRACSATHMPSSFGGSYPAAEIFRGCWGENIQMERMEWTAQPTFDARADSVDAFFDTYFFKTANSSIYPVGRATVNADALFTASPGYPTYRGVFGVIWGVISRNGRYGSRIDQNTLVSSGHSRYALYTNAASQIVQRLVYAENTALVDVGAGTGAGNRMGTGRADPYHVGAPVTWGAWVENEGGGGLYIEAISGQNNNPDVPGLQPNKTYNLQMALRGAMVQQFLAGVQAGADGSPTFTWTSPSFTPGLSVGATAQTGLTLDRAICRKAGDLYIGTLQLSKATLNISGTGNVTITGLPVSAANGGWVNVSYFSMLTSSSLVLAARLNGTTIELYKGSNLAAPLTHADLTNGALVLTVSFGIFA